MTESRPPSGGGASRSAALVDRSHPFGAGTATGTEQLAAGAVVGRRRWR